MENKVLKYMQDFSTKDISEFDHVLNNFGKTAKITDGEYERIYRKVMDKAGFEDSVAKDKYRKYKNTVVIKRITAAFATAAVLFLTFSLLVKNDEIYGIMYEIAPSIAQKLKPVNISCEDKGIKLKVISADIKEDTAYIYISVKDTEGDRIDKTVDLFDSYRINIPFDSSSHCQYIDFDEETRTGFFLIEISRMDGKNIEKYKDRKITFSFDTLLLNKKVESKVLSEINLGDTKKVTETVEKEDFYYDEKDDCFYDKIIKCLPPSEERLFEIEKDCAYVTGIGYTEAGLNIRIQYENTGKYDNHGFIHLVGENGGEIHCIDATTYRAGEYDNDMVYEYIFPVSYEELSEYKISGEFVTCNTDLKGDWEVTFRLDGE